MCKILCNVCATTYATNKRHHNNEDNDKYIASIRGRNVGIGIAGIFLSYKKAKRSGKKRKIEQQQQEQKKMKIKFKQ